MRGEPLCPSALPAPHKALAGAGSQGGSGLPPRPVSQHPPGRGELTSESCSSPASDHVRGGAYGQRGADTRRPSDSPARGRQGQGRRAKQLLGAQKPGVKPGVRRGGPSRSAWGRSPTLPQPPPLQGMWQRAQPRPRTRRGARAGLQEPGLLRAKGRVLEGPGL